MPGLLLPRRPLRRRLGPRSPRPPPEAIELAWRALLRRHHPDVAGDRTAALEARKRINVAHDWSRPGLREAGRQRPPGSRWPGLPAGPQAGYRPRAPHPVGPAGPWSRATAPGRPPRRSTRPPDLVRGRPGERLARFLDRVCAPHPGRADRHGAPSRRRSRSWPRSGASSRRRRGSAFDAAEEPASLRRVPRERWAEVGLRGAPRRSRPELVLAPSWTTLPEPSHSAGAPRAAPPRVGGITGPAPVPLQRHQVAALRARAPASRAELAAFLRTSQGIPSDDHCPGRRPWTGRGRGAADLRPARGPGRGGGRAGGRARAPRWRQGRRLAARMAT